MKINFSPRFLFDPVSSAAGGSPYAAAAQAAIGGIQSIASYLQSRSATKALEKLNSPFYTGNQSIKDYYDKALQRYNLSPYNTTLYKKTTQDVGRTTSQALDSLRGRGGAVAGVNNIVASANDNLLDAATRAEQMKAQEFNTLGGATGMKAADDRMKFQVNTLDPFERKYNLLAMKAGGGNQVANAGISNLYGGFQNLTNMDMLKNMYGDSGTGKMNDSMSGGTGGASLDWLIKNRKILR